ncbi:alpha-L-fucosidase [Parasediminibacterium sp. JCM 36343]|uniref:alpha-L-fucosidase n=1 Tax=Parasediminibacterium sp. JCM 36343 TaxID=3374279 RepID=UPI00397E420A
MKRMLLKKMLFTTGLIAGAIGSSHAQNTLPIVDGPYNPNKPESFKQYKCPEWFRDAKFGIWAHWGPQAVPRHGDWYAKKLYQQGSGDNKYHVATYGHPSKFGYKDIIPLWKAEKWDPEYLMKLYKKAGAKYFVSMGSHHDNFFLWKSKIHRWNAVEMGPHKDVVGIWQKAAKKEGLHFGVSEHLAASYTWFQTAHGADTSGEFKGVPYDGNDPAYADLYNTKAAPNDKGWITKSPEWAKEWFDDVKELVDAYHPDLVYSDSKLPFGDTGLAMMANYYNGNLKANNGKMQAVYNYKTMPADGTYVKDIERGVNDVIAEFPWQTDTSIGDWFYSTGQKYKSASEIIQMLVDIVSKNGNLLINIVQTPEGDIEQDMVNTLEDLGTWTSANGEGIYGSRPWKIYGEGPSTAPSQEKGHFGGLKDVRKYGSTDYRFTTKNGKVYVFVMEPPTADISIVSLGKNAKLDTREIAAVKLLGSTEKLSWKQGDDALTITKPSSLPKWKTVAFEVVFKK